MAGRARALGDGGNMLEWTGERFLPWVEDPEIHYEHLHRYRFAVDLVDGQRVLDLACGEGYGADLLASEAAEVVGIDIDPAAVVHATRTYRRDNLRFLEGSMTRLPLADEDRFDVITCFEALEHITEQEALLAEVKRLLAPGGLFLVSTPDKRTYSDEAGYDNPYHPKELYLEEFCELLGRHFSHTRLFGQKVYSSSHLFPVATTDGPTREYTIAREGSAFAFVPASHKAPRYYLAITSDEPVREDLGASYLLDVSKPSDHSGAHAMATAESEPPTEYAEAQELAKKGDLDAAIAILERLAEGPPPLAVAYNDLGVLFTAKGRKVLARRHYETAVELDPSNNAFAKNLADLYLVGFHRADDALALYTGVLQRDPDDGDAVLGAAQAHLMRGDREAAAELFRRLARLRPEARAQVEQALATLDPTPRHSTSTESVDYSLRHRSSSGSSAGGTEGSERWGGTEPLWFGSILPRIHASLPAAHILEIAPGLGSCTQYLKDHCEQLTVVDTVDQGIEAGRERFAEDTHIGFHVDNGASLAMVEDESIDFVFSWSSLVHAEADTVRAYLKQLATKLKPGGTGFIRHSHIGSHRDPASQQLTVENLHGRAESVSAELVRGYCSSVGLSCLSQELLTWEGTVFNDCISMFVREAQPSRHETAVWFNPHFMVEAERCRQIGDRYATARNPPEREALELARVQSHDEYWAWVAEHHDLYEERERIEQSLSRPSDSFTVPGECYVCGEHTNFRVGWEYAFESYQFRFSSNPRTVPNWREWLVCPKCGLNNRMRAAVHILEQELEADRSAAIYITEQTTALYHHLAGKFPRLVGSEHLGSMVARGEVNEDGIRNEDVTQLTFADDSFDLILSFDVFEHVPDVEAAFRECLRVLRPGGRMLFTIPFDRRAAANTVRARKRSDGTIEHLFEPEYHGDPLNAGGCLTFHNFGWQVLDQISAQGFTEVGAHLFWSRRFAHLGGDQIMFLAQKSAPADRAQETPASNRPVISLPAAAKTAPPPDGLICLLPFHFMQLFYGAAHTCCPDWTQHTLGNLRYQSIAEIWNGAAARRVREKMYRGEWQEICNPCCPHIAAFKQTGRKIPLAELDSHTELCPELIEDIRAGRTELSAPPTVFKLDNANTCNIDCIMCTRKAVADDRDLIERTMEEIEGCLPTAREIVLCGSGEPLAIRYARELLEADHSKNPLLKFHLITNGLLLPRLWPRIEHQRFGTMMVSVDAATRATYETIRAGGRWQDLQAALTLLAGQRHRFESVTLNMTVMRQNHREISEFVDRAASFGFDVSFQAVRGSFGDQNIFERRDRTALTEIAATIGRENARPRTIQICWGDLTEWCDAAVVEGAA
jgi:ubiquinone/menaquinone biosynthesis C-methylase UbiE/MoaA/NifB/PqqE/SkfB family radical SAM enzyme/Flp pilus assembly protein TadD